LTAQPAAAGKRAPRFHHAWLVALASALVYFVNSAIGSYLPGVLQPAWLAEFGWPQTWVVLPISLGTLLPGLAGLQIGRWTDRFGPRWILVVGAAITGIGYVFLSTAQGYAVFLIALTVSAIGRCGLSQVPASAGITRWFVTHRGKAMGFASTGTSMAGIVLVPVATALVLTVGWRWTVVVVGVGIWLLIIPFVWRVVRSRPSDLGLEPYGAGEVGAVQPAAREATLGGAVKGATFWLLAIGIMLGQAPSFVIGVHAQKAIIDKGATPAEAALVVSTLATGALVGRFGFALIADLAPSPMLLALMYTLQAMGYALLALSPFGPGIWFFAVLYGASLGGSSALQPVVVVDVFGVRAYGAIFGAIGTPAAVLSSLTPLIAAYVHDVTGTYTIAFLGLALVVMVGVGSLLLAFRSARRTAYEPQGAAS
jgi:MFS family permease